jgi:predicted Na+-dependent transporter
MRAIGQGLSIVGRHGPALLVLALVLGAAVAPLATAAYQVLPLSAFLLTLGSFLTASLALPEMGLGWRRILVALAWVGLGVPLIAAAGLLSLELDPALRAGVIISVLAPPVGSAAAIAAILGLQPRLALMASIALTLLAPLSMPAFATLLGIDVSIDMAHLTWRLTLIIGSAAVLAQMARHWRNQVQPVLPDQQAAAGVAVVGLVIVGLAMMSGIRAHWATDPDAFSLFMAAAIGVNVGAGLIGALLFSSWGAKDAFTVGLVSGNRNVTLAWAAAGSTLPVATEAYVAACVLPVLVLPLAIKSVLAARTRLTDVLGQQKVDDAHSTRPGSEAGSAPRDPAGIRRRERRRSPDQAPSGQLG